MVEEEMKEKIISYSIECEEALLGGLILDSSQFPEINKKLSGIEFHHKPFNKLYCIMKLLYDKYKSFDIPTILSRIEKIIDLDTGEEIHHSSWKNQLLELANNCLSIQNLNAYADVIREKYISRNLIALAEEIKSDKKRSKITNIGTYLDKIEKKVKSIDNHLPKNNFEASKELLAKYLEETAWEIRGLPIDCEYIKILFMEINKALVGFLWDFEELENEN